MDEYVGEVGAKLVQGILQRAADPKSSVAATLIGFGVLLYAASTVFVVLRSALNQVWGVPERPAGGVLGFVTSRLLPFGMILGAGLLLLASFVLSWGLSLAGNLVGELLPLPAWVFQIFQFLVSLAVVTVLFAIIYVVVPDKRIHWSDVWVGAAFTALLFTIGKTLLGLYLGYSSVGSAYGAAASLVLFLYWVYWSAQMFFFGAEFTEVYSRREGSRRVRRVRRQEREAA
jgi:membrane protein